MNDLRRVAVLPAILAAFSVVSPSLAQTVVNPALIKDPAQLRVQAQAAQTAPPPPLDPYSGAQSGSIAPPVEVDPMPVQATATPVVAPVEMPAQVPAPQFNDQVAQVIQAAPAAMPPLPTTGQSVKEFKDTYFSVTPSQIRDIYQAVQQRQRAVATPSTPPRSVTGTVNVSMSPGSTPPVIRAYSGYSTILVVTDSSGAPWPVENYAIGNRSLVNLARLDSQNGSSFSLEMLSPYGQTNIAMKLAGVPAPIILDVVSGQKEVDAKLEVRVAGRGPNATVSSVSTLPRGVDTRLIPVLNGISPEDGKALRVTGLDGISAWMSGSGKMVVRTPFKIVSPASRSFISSADGTYVYEFPPVTQLLGLVDGAFIPVQVSGW